MREDLGRGSGRARRRTHWRRRRREDEPTHGARKCCLAARSNTVHGSGNLDAHAGRRLLQLPPRRPRSWVGGLIFVPFCLFAHRLCRRRGQRSRRAGRGRAESAGMARGALRGLIPKSVRIRQVRAESRRGGDAGAGAEGSQSSGAARSHGGRLSAVFRRRRAEWGRARGEGFLEGRGFLEALGGFGF